MVSGYGSLNGTGPQQVWTSNTRTSQSSTNNTSTFSYEVRYYGNGYGSWGNSGSWSFTAGSAFYTDGTFSISQADAYKTYIVLKTGTYTVKHGSDGKLGAFNVRGAIAYNHTSIGTGEVNLTEPAPPRIPKLPGKPPKPVYVSSGTTTIDYTFAAPSDNGGASITTYNHQSATDTAFTQNLRNWNDSGSPGQATSLTPGTQHYIRLRAVNSVGAGAWSDALAGTTLPAVPPGLTVAAVPSGMAAILTFTPPGGVTGVTKYDWDRRVKGTTTPVATGSTTTTIAEVPGLVPGETYEWQATAWIGSYESPATGWIALKQPKPNTSPGDYFDGDTEDSADIDYSWTGTANASTSRATASGVDGWAAVTSSNVGGPILYRVTAGLFGTYAARVQLSSDMSAAGLRAGQKNADPYRTEVTAGAPYVGSIHVKPSRSQRLQAEITWQDSAGSQIAQSKGAATVVPGGEWVRLAYGGVAPDGAAKAIIRALDVTGTGWSAWLGGETMDLDGASISLNEQFPYFDGDTVDTSEFVYEWEGATNASVSTRTPVSLKVAAGSQDAPSLLAGCTVPPKPPRPPSIPSDCIVEVGVWRRYYVDIPSIHVSDWLSGVLTLRVASGAVEANQVRIRVYPNPFNSPSNEVDTTNWCSEQIISYLPKSTILTLDGVTQRAWAEVNGGSPQSADHLLYGTGGTPATWPILSCGISYLVSLEVPTTAPIGNVTIEAAVTTRT